MLHPLAGWRTALLVASMAPLFASVAALAGDPPVPTLAEQLKKAHVKPGSALEKLIRENQDFNLLRADELQDRHDLPPWLKVYWKKGHPEANYSASDPTGGYPHVLKEVYEWLVSHQDLRPGQPENHMRPGWDAQPAAADGGEEEAEARERGVSGLALSALVATPGTNVRTSGAQTSARSESDIRVNFWNTSKIIGASNNISGSGFQAQFYSADGGATWGQTTLPNPLSDSFNSDPTVDWTSDGTAWATTMGIVGSTNKIRAFKSADGGATWSYDNTITGSQTNVDKQMMWVDHSASSANANNIYVIWHNGNPAFMNRRTASGWGSPIQVSGAETTGTGIGADVRTNSAGDVFGMWPDTGSRGLYVVKSTTGGASYGVPVKIATTYDSYDIGVPAFASRRILIYLSAGAYRNGTRNNVYAVWSDLSGDSGCTAASSEPGTNAASSCKTRIWFARSTDGGATWGASTRLNHQASLNDQFNPGLAVDETSGALGVMYYDTVGDSTRKATNVWYQSSTDDGATWSAAVKVTTAATDETTTGSDSGNQYGDYNTLSGAAGSFFPSWTDRRSGGKEEIWTAKVTDGTGPATYSIAGSAGTPGATVSTGATSTTSDASNNYALSGLVAGTYTVSASKSGCTFSPSSASVTVGPSATGVNFTATCASGDTQLTSGVTLTGQSVALNSWKYYSITVPTGASQLVFATSNATADVDIYTQANVKPTLTTYTCRPYTSSGNESCSATNPVAGTWWLGVYGYAAGSYSVTATVTTPAATYSVSGNAGTAGATLSTGGASATSDASSNYTIANLAAGTYTVTPSKSGCSFAPASLSVTVGPNATGQNFTATCTASSQLFLNPGFESGNVNWVATAGVITNSSSKPARTGSWKAWLGGVGSTSTKTMYQDIAIPSTVTSASLSFWLRIDTSETTTSTQYDKLQVQIRNTANTLLATLATYSNLNANSTYAQKTFDVTSYKGTTIRVFFNETEDVSLQTSFVLDDMALNTQ